MIAEAKAQLPDAWGRQSRSRPSSWRWAERSAGTGGIQVADER